MTLRTWLVNKSTSLFFIRVNEFPSSWVPDINKIPGICFGLGQIELEAPSDELLKIDSSRYRIDTRYLKAT